METLTAARENEPPERLERKNMSGENHDHPGQHLHPALENPPDTGVERNSWHPTSVTPVPTTSSRKHKRLALFHVFVG